MTLEYEMTGDEHNAISLAMKLHEGQKDKNGEPYHLHSFRVANKVKACGGSQDQIVAAYLHDVIEDTPTSLADLTAEGISAGAILIIGALTHQPNERNATYLNRILLIPGARLVKLCDIWDNLDPARMVKLDYPTQTRLYRKYGASLTQLAMTAETW